MMCMKNKKTKQDKTKGQNKTEKHRETQGGQQRKNRKTKN